MRFNKKNMNLEEGLEKEWIITNGIGGYASSTIIGANTRKYHGLLVAPLTPPARRHLILSKVDESIKVDGKSYPLYTNVCKNFIAEGYKNQEYFEKDYIPKFKYKVNDIEVDKEICLINEKNTVCIYYKIKNANSKAKFVVAPIANFRDFHCTTSNHIFSLKQYVTNNKTKIVIDEQASNPIYMYMSEGNYIEHKDDYFKNMYYIEEQKRGFYPEEDHVVPGRYEIEIMPNEEKEISFICSLDENIEEISTKDEIQKEIRRLDKIIEKTELIDENNKEKELIKDLIIATDSFIVYRPSFRLHTLIAGYHWFLDWGRDALISFEGLLLQTKRFEIAKEVLLTFVINIKYGLVPNGYSGFDNRPLYNSADSSLLLFEQIHKYINYTGDYKFVKEELYEVLEKIIEAYKTGIDVDNNNIYLDDDNLIVSGTPETQNTWMDAKCGSFAVTPRNGKAVEINALWYNALKILEELSIEFGYKENANEYKTMAKDTKNSFNKNFYNKKKKCLYDVLGDDKIRPNQLFSLSLTYPVVEPKSEEAKEIINTCKKKLLNKYGLKTLAKGEEGYVDVYEGAPLKRDTSYHQGITWPWLLGIYNDAYKKVINAERDKKLKQEMKEDYNKFIKTTKQTFKKAIYQDSAVGSICEIYDSKAPYKPKGTISQAWSVAEIFRIINEEVV